MKSAALMINTVQEYAWGDETSIPELLDLPIVQGRPMAELWMGAHPKAPSKVVLDDGRTVSLIDLIAADPVAVLGKRVQLAFGEKLPFLFKVLAVARPLSIQAHPDKRNAVEGFARENDLGIPLDAPNRNYRDANHKPECLSALTPFWGLCGFRPLEDILTRLAPILDSSQNIRVHFRDAVDVGQKNGLKVLFQWLLSLSDDLRWKIIESALEQSRKMSGADAVYKWVLRLHQQYPMDIGILSPILLNLVRLEPGQAIFLAPGELHAYLEGVGIELMANSDNVLRGGLTPKHIDPTELMRVVRFREKAPEIHSLESVDGSESGYPVFADEFKLSVVSPNPEKPVISGRDRSVDVLICLEGAAAYREIENNFQLTLQKGSVLLVPASVAQYEITGSAVLYKASVP